MCSPLYRDRVNGGAPTERDAAYARAGGLLPAEAGVVLRGTPQSAHVLATFVDLAHRGWVRIETVTDGDPPDLELIQARPPSRWRFKGREPVSYERRLLKAAFADAPRTRISTLHQGRLAWAVRALVRRCFANGWLSPGAGPCEGNAELLAELRDLSSDVEALRPPSGTDPADFYNAWLPYAISFGLNPAWTDLTTVLRVPEQRAAAFPGPSYDELLRRFASSVRLPECGAARARGTGHGDHDGP